MCTVWQPKLKKHLSKYHLDAVSKEGPTSVLNRVLWRSKAGQRRLHSMVVYDVVNDEMSKGRLSRDSLVNVAINVLQRALVKVADDDIF